jgi:predicted dehydrogenase
MPASVGTTQFYTLGRRIMSSDKLRVGVIGAGLIALAAHVPQLRESGRAEVVAVSRRNPERLAKVQRQLGIAEAYTDWQEMLDKSRLDAVVVSTPHNAHVEPTLAALNRGLHVFLEKPSADTLDGALQIAEAADRSGCVVTVGFNSRGSPTWRSVRNAIHSGAIGSLRQINLVCAVDGRWLRQRVSEAPHIQNMRKSSEIMNLIVDDWMGESHWMRNTHQVGGDLFISTGVHAVDVLLWIADAKPVEVVAFKPSNPGIATAAITVQARLSSDVLMSITFTDVVNEGESEWNGYGIARSTLMGDCGTVTVDSTGLAVQTAKDAWLERNSNREQLPNEEKWINTIDAFLNTVLDGAPNLCSAEEGAQSVALIQSAYRSSAERQIVKVM